MTQWPPAVTSQSATISLIYSPSLDELLLRSVMDSSKDIHVSGNSPRDSEIQSLLLCSSLYLQYRRIAFDDHAFPHFTFSKLCSLGTFKKNLINEYQKHFFLYVSTLVWLNGIRFHTCILMCNHAYIFIHIYIRFHIQIALN